MSRRLPSASRPWFILQAHRCSGGMHWFITDLFASGWSNEVVVSISHKVQPVFCNMGIPTPEHVRWILLEANADAPVSESYQFGLLLRSGHQTQRNRKSQLCQAVASSKLDGWTLYPMEVDVNPHSGDLSRKMEERLASNAIDHRQDTSPVFSPEDLFTVVQRRAGNTVVRGRRSLI